MEWTTKMEGGGTLYLRDDGLYMYLEANRPEGQPGLYKVILQGVQGGQVLGTMEPCDTGLKLSRMVSRATLGQWGCLPLTKVICQLTYPFPTEEKQDSPLEKEEVLAPSLWEEKVSLDEEIPPKEEQTPEEEVVWEGLQEEPEEILWTEVTAPEEEREGFRPCPQPSQWMSDPVLVRGIGSYEGVLRQEREDGFALAIPFSADKAFPLTPLFCLAQPKELQGRKYLVFSFGHHGRPCQF